MLHRECARVSFVHYCCSFLMNNTLLLTALLLLNGLTVYQIMTLFI